MGVSEPKKATPPGPPFVRGGVLLDALTNLFSERGPRSDARRQHLVHPDGQRRRDRRTDDQGDRPQTPELLHLPPHQEAGGAPEDHRDEHRVDGHGPEPAGVDPRRVGESQVQSGEEPTGRELVPRIVGRPGGGRAGLEVVGDPPAPVPSLDGADQVGRIADGRRVGLDPELREQGRDPLARRSRGESSSGRLVPPGQGSAVSLGRTVVERMNASPVSGSKRTLCSRPWPVAVTKSVRE